MSKLLKNSLTADKLPKTYNFVVMVSVFDIYYIYIYIQNEVIESTSRVCLILVPKITKNT